MLPDPSSRSFAFQTSAGRSLCRSERFNLELEQTKSRTMAKILLYLKECVQVIADFLDKVHVTQFLQHKVPRLMGKRHLNYHFQHWKVHFQLDIAEDI